MAMIKCPQCGKEISEQAFKCPSCGCLVKEELEKEARRKAEEERKECERLEAERLEKERKEAEEKRRLQEEKRKQEEEIRKHNEMYMRCPECSAEVKRDVDVCPECGFPIAEAAKVNVEAAKKRKKLILIAGVVCVCVIAIILMISSSNRRKLYENAIADINNGNFSEAGAKLEELGSYEDSAKYIEIVRMAEKLSETYAIATEEYVRLESLKALSKSIFSQTEGIPELSTLREEVVEGIYQTAENYEFATSGISDMNDNDIDDGLDRKYLLALLVEDERDVSEIKATYTDYSNYTQAINNLIAEDFEGAYELTKGISNNNEEPARFKKEYMKLYENCSPFLGSWKTKEYLGDSFQLSFAYSSDEYDAKKYAELHTPYLRITVADMPMSNEDLTHNQTAYCYKNLKIKDGKISFDFRFGETDDSTYNKVICQMSNGKCNVTLDGKECELYKPVNRADDGKEEPYIGMSEYDAEYNCSWGEPSDKNITETEYGRSEQWVYPGYGYLYIEDGKVTAIQK